jgi:hypothetical protein
VQLTESGHDYAHVVVEVLQELNRDIVSRERIEEEIIANDALLNIAHDFSSTQGLNSVVIISR